MTVDRDPTKTAVREAKRQQRLGPGAACVLCGFSGQAALTVVRDPEIVAWVNRRILEQHHPFGRAHQSDLLSVLCRNHHALATDEQLRNLVSMQFQDNPLERQVAIWRSRAAFDRVSADAADEQANHLEEIIRLLDAEFPSWRELWEKKQ